MRERLGKKLELLVFSTFISIIASGCMGAQPKMTLKGGEPPPSWIETGKYIKYPGSFYLTGTGISSEGIRAADDIARQELAKQIKFRVTGVEEIVTSETSKTEGDKTKITAHSKVQSDIKVEVDILLEGVSIGERWFNKSTGQYYSLAVLEREDAVKRIDRKVGEAKKGASDNFNRAVEEEGGEEYFQALKSYLRTYVYLKDIQPDLVIRSVIAGAWEDDTQNPTQRITLPEVRSRIDRIISGIKLQKVSGDNQKGRSQYPLDAPLVAKIVYESNQESTPLKGVPLIFSFTHGKGELRQENLSNDLGMIQSKVTRVESTGREENTIRLTIDTEKILAPFSRDIIYHVNVLQDTSLNFSFTVPSLYSEAPQKLLSKEKGIKELIFLLINNIKDLQKIPLLKLAVFDFVEIRSQNRLNFSNSLENDIKTNLALLRNVNVQVVDKENEDISLTPVEKAQSLNVPYLLTGGYQIEKQKVKVSAKLLDVSSNVLISAASVILERDDFDETEFVLKGASTENREYSSVINTILDKKPKKTSFTIDIWTDQKEYKIGDTVQFYFRADKDCYLTLINIGTSGNVTYLFPNSFHQNSFIEGGKTYTIPGPEYGFNIDINGPPGLERVKAIASTTPLSLNKVDLSNGFFGIKPTNTRRTRDLSVSVKKLPPTGWTETTYEFYVKPPKGVRYRGIKKKVVRKPEKPIDIIGTQGYSK